MKMFIKNFLSLITWKLKLVLGFSQRKSTQCDLSFRSMCGSRGVEPTEKFACGVIVDPPVLANSIFPGEGQIILGENEKGRKKKSEEESHFRKEDKKNDSPMQGMA